MFSSASQMKQSEDHIVVHSFDFLRNDHSVVWLFYNSRRNHDICLPPEKSWSIARESLLSYDRF